MSALILLVGIGSFALGKLSDDPTLARTATPATIQVREVPHMATTTYVASKNGTSYHLPWCPGAGQIKKENKLVFDAKEKAEAAGYAPAGNCPGLSR